jgi:Spy/CpxP family protein refolding chaperone
MNRRTTILIALIVAVVALAAMPALAQEPNTAERPDRPQRLYPPAWVDETVDELRSRIAGRNARAEDRIADSTRLTDEQKTQALENLADATTAIAAADEPAEIVGTATSRAQLQRIAWRAERKGVTPDYEEHIARDIVQDTRRYDHLVTITGWADAAGVDVSAVNGYLDNASAQLAIAGGSGTVVQRHDAVHVARAWMIQAHTTLLAE